MGGGAKERPMEFGGGCSFPLADCYDPPFGPFEVYLEMSLGSAVLSLGTSPDMYWN